MSLNIRAVNDRETNFLTMQDDIVGNILISLSSQNSRLWEALGTQIMSIVGTCQLTTDAPWRMLYNHLFATDESRDDLNFPRPGFKEPYGNHKKMVCGPHTCL